MYTYSELDLIYMFLCASCSVYVICTHTRGWTWRGSRVVRPSLALFLGQTVAVCAWMHARQSVLCECVCMCMRACACLWVYASVPCAHVYACVCMSMCVYTHASMHTRVHTVHGNTQPTPPTHPPTTRHTSQQLSYAREKIIRARYWHV